MMKTCCSDYDVGEGDMSTATIPFALILLRLLHALPLLPCLSCNDQVELAYWRQVDS